MYRIKTKGKNKEIIELFGKLKSDIDLRLNGRDNYCKEMLNSKYLYLVSWPKLYLAYGNRDTPVMELKNPNKKINLDQLKLMVAEKELNDSKVSFSKVIKYLSECNDKIQALKPIKGAYRLYKAYHESKETLIDNLAKSTANSNESIIENAKKISEASTFNFEEVVKAFRYAFGHKPKNKIPADEIIDPDCLRKLSETIDKMKEVIKPFKREVGKVYKSEWGIIMCTSLSGDRDDTWSGYGLHNNLGPKWCNDVNWSKSQWQEEATDKEWLEALTKEAEKQGHNHKALRLYDNCRLIDHLGNIILKDGQWAEIIPEKKVLFTTEEGVKMYDDGNGLSDKKSYFIESHDEDLSGCGVFNYFSGKATWGKYFHSKDAAIAYIKERDKPKRIEHFDHSVSGKRSHLDSTFTYGFRSKHYMTWKELEKLIEEALNKKS